MSRVTVGSKRKRQDKGSGGDIRWRLAVASVSLTVAMIGALGSLISIRSDASRRSEQARAIDTAALARDQQNRLAALTQRLNESEEANAKAQQQLLQMISRPGGVRFQLELTAADHQVIENLAKTSANMNERLTALEGALLQTPEKAIAVPLLKQQLNDTQDKAKGDSDALHGEINHLYGMMQWFLGLMITLIIGVAGLVLNSFRQSGDKQKTHVHDRAEEPRQAATVAGNGTTGSSPQQTAP